MRKDLQGNTIVITRGAGNFIVLAISRAGVAFAEMICDTFEEAQAAFAYGPARW